MKLFYSKTSPYVRKVLLLAHETGLMDQIELVPTNPIADLEFRKVNPMAKIPALVVDENKPTLFESATICDYLDRIHGGDLMIPEDNDERIKVMYLHGLGQGITDAAVGLRFQAIREEKLGTELPKDWWIDRFYEAMNTSMDLLEDMVDQLDGPLNLGVFSVAASLPFVDFRLPDFNWREGRPKLAGWLEKFQQRPSMQATIPHE